MEILLDTLKWSAVVGTAALALTALKPLLDKRYSPKWRYGAWLVLAVMLLLAPVQWERLLPQVEAPAPAVVIEIPRLTVSREEGTHVQAPAAMPSGTAGSYAPAETAKRVLEPEQVLTALWLAGAALFILYHLVGTALLQRRARRWSRIPGAETSRIYEEVQREMGLRRVPPLRVSARVDSPMLTGLLRPRLLLPGEDFGERELRFILHHELTHWRRHDLWHKLVVLAANAVHWFNPLVYLMSREASRDIELTCDALVVANADAETRRAYSETLLASIHRQRGLGRTALTTHFYGGAEVMKERFRHILGKQGRKWGGIVLALTLLATVATACAVGVQQEGGEPEKIEGPADQTPEDPGNPEDTENPSESEEPTLPDSEEAPEQSGSDNPEEPAITNPTDTPDDPQGYEKAPGELTADELEAFAAWFNPGDEHNSDTAARNGLLRFPYENFDGIRHYMEELFYDAGERITDEAERTALEERIGTTLETDCKRLTREYIREFLTWNFAEDISEADMTRLLEEDISLPNLPEYDAFYLIHGDTSMQFYEFERGVWEADGTVKLYYTTDLFVYAGNGELDILWDQPMCVTMGLTRNGTWGVISNIMVTE